MTWGACVLLALAALSILLARPVCDVFGAVAVASSEGRIAAHEHASGDASHPSHDRDPCCDQLDPFAIPVASTPAAEGRAFAVLLIDGLRSHTPRAIAWRDVDARAIEHRPRSRPYHARTARILA